MSFEALCIRFIKFTKKRAILLHWDNGFLKYEWRATKGVSRLVRFGVNPAKVHDGLIDHLRATEAALQANPEPLFTSGEHVRLTDRAFAGIEGVYQMADGDRRVMC